MGKISKSCLSISKSCLSIFLTERGFWEQREGWPPNQNFGENAKNKVGQTNR